MLNFAPPDYERYAPLLTPPFELAAMTVRVTPSPREIEKADPVNPALGRRRELLLNEKVRRQSPAPAESGAPAPALRSSVNSLNSADLSWLIETANNVQSPTAITSNPSNQSVAKLYSTPNETPPVTSGIIG